MAATREDLVKLAREAAEGFHRPSYCENPASFDPHEWVLEAMQAAYKRGASDVGRVANQELEDIKQAILKGGG